MNAEELKRYVRTMLNAAFPWVSIQFEQISDDPYHIGVGVYGVAPEAVKWVEDRILDIDAKICTDTEFALTPLVRDEATTEKYYPQFASPWTALRMPPSSLVSCSVETKESAFDFVYPSVSLEWGQPRPSADAANQELALAA